MRDERFVDRFMYAWNDTLFFDPIEMYYTPAPDHFLAELDEPTRSRFVRNGIWWSFRSATPVPEQGWKIHVSAGRNDVRDVASAVIGYLTARGINFKIALDLNIFQLLNSRTMPRGSSGKLATVYPRDDDAFRTCLADLADLLGPAEGAYVLSDLRYRDCRSLYFRYGQFRNTHTVDVMGRPAPHIVGPDGPVPDQRRPEYVQPWWVPWPFTDWKPADDAGDAGDDDLIGGRFRVTGAIQFSNSGGVYLAEDTADGDRRVVLKEARPHTNINRRGGYDATDVHAREWAFLNRLAGAGQFPKPITRFRHWEHDFIAEEFVEKVDIRTVLFTHNPLTRPAVTVEQSRDFLRIFLAIFRSFARAVRAAHDRGVVLVDLSASNIMVDSDTFEVTIVDLEACRLVEPDPDLPGLERQVDLYTPGFTLSRSGSVSDRDADLHSVAMVMAYVIFPIAAMAFLRNDTLDHYRVLIERLGWPERIHDILAEVALARLPLGDVVDVLEREEPALVDAVTTAPRPTADELLPGLADVEAGVAGFVEAVADTSRYSLFPVDPFAHLTNPLSLGFGASGVLWALDASGVTVRPEWREWLGERLADIDLAEYPDGLMAGLAGIAWAADALGFREPARRLLAEANRRAPGAGDYTFYYGLAGLGMTNLRFHLRDRADRHLAAARECARLLADTVQYDGSHAYWRNGFTPDRPLTGLGFGQAGVALFLLRMYQATGDGSHLRLGRAALDWELANATTSDDGLVTFAHGGTAVPYVEVGAAGVAQVLLRYGDLAAARTVLRSLDIGQSALPAYGFGISGVADALLDAAAITGDGSYRDAAVRQLDYIRRLFLFEPPERYGVPRRAGVRLLALPGEGLLRCACDYLTGSAGVLRVLHRAHHGGTADFLLDELTP